jgi:hypothetical protein
MGEDNGGGEPRRYISVQSLKDWVEDAIHQASLLRNVNYEQFGYAALVRACSRCAA